MHARTDHHRLYNCFWSWKNLPKNFTMLKIVLKLLLYLVSLFSKINIVVQGGSQKILLTTKESIVFGSIFSGPSCINLKSNRANVQVKYLVFGIPNILVSFQFRVSFVTSFFSVKNKNNKDHWPNWQTLPSKEG